MSRTVAILALAASATIAVPLHAAGASAAGSAGTRMLRSPTVSATQIAFAYAQNIWAVDRAGGVARRLTSFQGQASNPHFSPDGSGSPLAASTRATSTCTSCRRRAESPGASPDTPRTSP